MRHILGSAVRGVDAQVMTLRDLSRQGIEAVLLVMFLHMGLRERQIAF